MLNKISKTLCAILSILIISSCGHIQIKDAEWCGDLGQEGATCFHTISDANRDLTKAEWDIERFGQVCTTADSFANWKEAILKFCYLTKKCTYDAKQQIIQFNDKVQKFAEKSTTVEK